MHIPTEGTRDDDKSRESIVISTHVVPGSRTMAQKKKNIEMRFNYPPLPLTYAGSFFEYVLFYNDRRDNRFGINSYLIGHRNVSFSPIIVQSLRFWKKKTTSFIRLDPWKRQRFSNLWHRGIIHCTFFRIDAVSSNIIAADVIATIIRKNFQYKRHFLPRLAFYCCSYNERVARLEYAVENKVKLMSVVSPSLGLFGVYSISG